MKSTDVICLAMLAKDIDEGVHRAVRLLRGQRAARPGAVTTAAYLERVRRICIRSCSSALLSRFLRSHGVPHVQLPDDDPGAALAAARLQIGATRARVLTYILPPREVTPQELMRALAIVRATRGGALRQESCAAQRFVFAFFAGELKLSLRQNLRALLQPAAALSAGEIGITALQARIYLTAAPDLEECRRQFRPLPRGTACLQFPTGTPMPALGCPITQLTSFKSIVHWGGV